MVGGGHFFGNLQWRVTSLIIGVGGLILYSEVEDVSYAFLVFRVQSWLLQDHILRDGWIYDMHSDFDDVLEVLGFVISDFNLKIFGEYSFE